MSIRDLLRILGSPDRKDGRNLTHKEAYQAFGEILDGGISDIQTAAFLVAISWKGVTVEELTGFAQAARDRASIPCKGMSGLVFSCPPLDGHDRYPPLEVASGLVAAGAGIRVLIVADRDVPPRRGLTALDVMDYFGVGATTESDAAEERVGDLGFAVLSASSMLPALSGLRRVRGEVAVRTPMSTVEKLIAPSTAAVLLGAQAGPVLGRAVETMSGLGHPRGIALQGVDGGVVPTLRKRTRGIELAGSHQVPLTVEPADFGLSADSDPELPMYGPPEDGTGLNANPMLVKAAGDMIETVLQGETGAIRDATLLGSAVLLKAAGRSMTLAEGVDLATDSLDSGAALEVLRRLRHAK